MFTKEVPRWITLGGMLLACSAGAINAVGLLGLHHQALTHASGVLTILGAEVAYGDVALALRSALVVTSFFAGCVVSGWLIQHSTLQLGRRYGLALFLESLLLVGATVLLRREVFAGNYLAAMACGLQNAMATSYSGAVIRTTHMTGIVTDLGIATGHLLRGAKIDGRRMRLYGALLIGFFAGSVLGALGYTHLGYTTLLIPATASGAAGLAYVSVKHWERRQAAATVSPR